MQKLLIAVEGVSNSGKTTTLKKFLSLLQKDPKTISIRIQNDVKKKKPNEFYIPKIGDMTCIFELALINNKLLKIGIATGGDTLDIVSSNLTYFDNNNCDVMFCATKSRGQTVDYIHNYIDNEETIFLPFFKACDTNKHDTKLAQDIVNTALKWFS